MDSWHDEVDETEEDGIQDFLPGGKDAIIFLIDASSDNMHMKNEEDEYTFFEMTLKAVISTLRKKVCTEL